MAQHVTSTDVLLRPNLNNFRRHYGVEINHHRGTDPAVKIHYTIDAGISTRYNNQQAPERILHLNRHQVYINNEMPHSPADRLADVLGKTLYPLEIALADNHSLYKLTNQEKIVQRYNAIARDLLAYYDSKLGRAALDAFSKNIFNPTRMRAALHGDWFIYLVFGGILFCQYVKGYLQDGLFMLPVIPYRPPVVFTGSLSLEQSADDEVNGVLRIKLDATCTDPRNWKDAWKGKIVPLGDINNPMTGHAQFTFLLSQYDRTIVVAEGSVNLSGNNQHYASRIGIYDLHPVLQKRTTARPGVELLEAKELSSKSFFQKLFTA
jgi:hypothetical protein